MLEALTRITRIFRQPTEDERRYEETLFRLALRQIRENDAKVRENNSTLEERDRLLDMTYTLLSTTRGYAFTHPGIFFDEFDKARRDHRSRHFVDRERQQYEHALYSLADRQITENAERIADDYLLPEEITRLCRMNRSLADNMSDYKWEQTARNN